jgi:GT2 family glycosyltransferase
MMTKKTIFNKIMGFSEKYEDCFEDVEYNIMCKSIGLKNIFDGTSVAYHLESQTRNLDSNKLEKQSRDWDRLCKIIDKQRDFISDKLNLMNI